MPLMENGGNNDHTPWHFDNENSTQVTDTYRLFTTQHYELVPYFMTIGAQAYEAGVSSVRPLAPTPSSFIPIQNANLSTYDYMLGSQILFSPTLEEGLRSQNVTFPYGSDWYNIFDPI